LQGASAPFFKVARSAKPRCHCNEKGGKMAKTKDGKKIVEVRRHKRRLANGKIVVVPEYRRSTPN